MKKILVIEDNDLLRENISEILELEGYFVKSAENGKVGIEAALADVPDLIISDINMPLVDGYGVIAALREEESTKTVPFIFLTVKDSLQDMRSGMNLGANDYLTKPFDMTDLLTAVSKRLEMSEQIIAKETEKYNRLKNSVGLPIANIIDDPLRNIERMSEMVTNEVVVLNADEIREISKLIGSSAAKLRKEIVKILYFYRIEALKNNEKELDELKLLKTTQTANRIKSICEGVASDFGRNSDLYLHVNDGAIQFPQEFLDFTVKELVENAFKYSARNCPVKVMAQPVGGNYEITIQDKGIGFKNSSIDNLEPYTKDQSGYRQGDGLGLGLYDVKSLIHLFEGEISLQSEAGLGSAFILSLKSA